MIRRPAAWLLFCLGVAGLNWAATADNAPVVISEFMAKNTAGLTDEEGICRDWIELRNVTGGAVNLEGWFLADSTNKAKWWTFPATNIAANGYLIVFASGNNRAVPGFPLHTSFQIDAGGGYLALIEPDGVTVATGFNPYPQQYKNISYGGGRTIATHPLVASGATAWYHVPTNGVLDTLWMQRSFDASGWSHGPTGIGFDTQTATASAGLYAYWPIAEGTGNAASNWVAGGASGILHGAVWTTDPERGTVLSFDGQSSYVEAGAIPMMGQSTSNFTWSFWYRQRSVPNGNAVVLGNRSGGGSDTVQFIKFTPSNFEYYHDGNVGFISHTLSSDQWLHLAVVKNGAEMQYYENGVAIGGSTASSDIEQNPFYWGGDPGAPGENADGLLDDISLWTSALSADQIQRLYQGVSPAALTGVGGAVATDIGGAMRGVNASAWLRVPFTVPEGASFTSLELSLQYDDGFATYLNGTLLAARNAPDSLAWNSAATGEHSLNLATTWEKMVVSAALGALQTGSNVLAIHGLNLSPGDSDFLILPALAGVVETSLGARYFPEPTPGTANGAGYLGVIETVQFDRARGFYDAPFTLALACATTEAAIYYTTNGVDPTATSGTRYTGPMAISGTTCVRANAFLDGWLVPGSVTRTYLFLDQVLAQTGAGMPNAWGNDWQMDPRVVTNAAYAGRIRDDLKSLPVVSIVLDPEDFWGPAGIYTQASSRGDDYEKPCSAEMFFPDGSQPGFQINCGTHIVGSASRSMSPKHGVGLFFRSKYGAGKLKYKFFDNSDLTEFDSLAFRPNFNMSWVRTDYSGPLNNGNADGAERTHAIYVRDQFTKDSQRAMGSPSAHERFVHLYIDGLYWGLYNPSERTDASFAAAYLGGLKEDYDAIFSDPSTVPVATDGNTIAWNQMLAIARGGVTDATSYAKIQQYANVTNLADYMMLNFYCATVDWPWQNWNAARKRETNALFHFFAWDAEYTLETPPWVPADRTSVGADSSEANSPAYLYNQLRQNAEWRLLFADRAHLQLFNNGALTTNQTIPRFISLCDSIDSAIVGESARWGDVVRTSKPYTRNAEWLTEKQRLLTDFFPQRTSLLINQLINADLYPRLAAPEFSAQGGDFTAPFQLSISSASGVTYYTTNGVDPRVTGGAIDVGAKTYQGPITIGTSQTVLARTLKSGVWSALTAATFTNTAPPSLLVQVSGSSILISWPDAATGYTLEFTDNLSLPQWSAVPNVSGTQAVLDTNAVARFYRLKK